MFLFVFFMCITSNFFLMVPYVSNLLFYVNYYIIFIQGGNHMAEILLLGTLTGLSISLPLVGFLSFFRDYFPEKKEYFLIQFFIFILNIIIGCLYWAWV